MTRPIFYDPTGRRSLLAKRSLAVAFLAVILAALAFATTLVAVPRQREIGRAHV